MTQDNELSRATATAAEPPAQEPVPLQPALMPPPDVVASRWRRLIAGLLDGTIGLIVGVWIGALVSNAVELGTSASATAVVVAGWLGAFGYLASPWTLARRAFGMRIANTGARRGARMIRGLVRALLFPVNGLMVLVANRHLGDMVTRTRTVRARGSGWAVALVPLVIVIGPAAASQLFLRAGTHSEAWTKARQASGSKAELQQFIFGDSSAVFDSPWGHQELVRLGTTWHVIRAQERTTSDDFLTFGLEISLSRLTIGASSVTTSKVNDVSEVRAELLAKLAQQIEQGGQELRDVECDEFTGPSNECRAGVAKPGEQATAVRIAIRLDDDNGMVGKISARE